MGHYDDAYEYDDAAARKDTSKNRKIAIKHLEEALAYSRYADNSEVYTQKLKEAILWLGDTK